MILRIAVDQQVHLMDPENGEEAGRRLRDKGGKPASAIYAIILIIHVWYQ